MSRGVVTLRLTDEERALAGRAATVNRQTFSEFVRDALLQAASECLEDVVVRGSRAARRPVPRGSGVIRRRVNPPTLSGHHEASTSVSRRDPPRLQPDHRQGG